MLLDLDVSIFMRGVGIGFPGNVSIVFQRTASQVVLDGVLRYVQFSMEV